MAISLRQLEYFVTVVDEGSFTRAAEVLQVSQPGLSHQVQALERELGGPLLERLPRRVRLTPAGRTALPHARASLAHAQRPAHLAARLPRTPSPPRRTAPHRRPDLGHGGRPSRCRGRPDPARLGRPGPGNRRGRIPHRRRTRHRPARRPAAGPDDRPSRTRLGALHHAQRPVRHPRRRLLPRRIPAPPLGPHRTRRGPSTSRPMSSSTPTKARARARARTSPAPTSPCSRHSQG
jgi:Bacterial regulatory helix-turn-helix protein, lysR family